MPMPKFNVNNYHLSVERRQNHQIIHSLIAMGYDIEQARDAVEIIESKNLDQSQFEFPYGSFDAYKQHVLDGEFDIDMAKRLMTDEKRNQLKKNVEEKNCG